MAFLGKLIKVLLIFIVFVVIAAGAAGFYVSKQPPKPFLEKIAQDFADIRLTVAEDTQLKLWPQATLTTSDFSIRKSGKQPFSASGKNTYLKLPAWPVLTQSYLSGAFSGGDPIQLLPLLSASEVKAEGVEAAWQVDKQEQTLQAKHIKVEGAGRDILVDASGTLNKEQPFEVAGKLTPNGADVLLDLSAKTPQAHIALKGKVAPDQSFQGQVLVNTGQIGKVLQPFVKELSPQLALLPFSANLDGTFTATKQDIQKLDVTLGEAIKAEGNLTLDLEEQNIEGSINTSALNLDSLALCGKKGSDKKADAAPWSDKIIDQKPLQAWTVNLDATLNGLACNAMPIQTVKLKVKNSNKALNLRQLNVLFDQGGQLNLTGNVEYRSRGVFSTFESTLAQVPVEGFTGKKNALGNLEKPTKFKLPLNGSLKGEFYGNSTQSWVENLSGNIDLYANSGQIPGAVFAMMALNVAKASGMATKEVNQVDKLIAKYSIDKGVAKAEDVQLSVGQNRFQVRVTGKADLARWTILHKIEPIITTGTLIKIPVNVKGSLSKPKFVPEIANAQNIATGAGALVGGPAGAAVGSFLGNMMNGGTAQDALNEIFTTPEKTQESVSSTVVSPTENVDPQVGNPEKAIKELNIFDLQNLKF